MLETLFHVTKQQEILSVSSALAYLGTALIFGALLVVVYALISESRKRSISFCVTLLILPAIVAFIILLVGTDVARALSIAGVFTLVRFRSATGEGKDIALVFLAMGVGLSCGLGYLTFAFLMVLGVGIIIVLAYKVLAVAFADGSKKLRILIPEDMEYEGAFDDLFAIYFQKVALEKVKTTNMGTLFELTYDVVEKKQISEKKLLDEIRCRNGNLTVMLYRKESSSDKL